MRAAWLATLLLACATEETPTVVVRTEGAPSVGASASANASADVRVAAAAPPPATPTDPRAREGTVEPGDSLSKIAASMGLSAAAIAELVAALEPVFDPTTIRAGQTWSARLDGTGKLVAFTLAPSPTVRIEVTRTADGELVAAANERETDIEVATLAATIDSSLSSAVTSSGGDAALVAAIVDVLASQIDFYTDPRKGDRIALVYERHRLDGAHVKNGRVLAVAYVARDATTHGLWWTPPGAREGAWFLPDGKSLDRTLLKSPLKYARTSSKFDPRRMHPVLHRVKGHFGVDYAAPVGTPVWAAAGGEIVFRGEQGGAGNLVVLRHDGGFSTVYMHLSKFASGQKVGDTVAQKQVIGYVGNTGLSTGPHLHFGVKRGGRWVDPAKVRAIERPGVAKKQRARFDRDTADVRTQLATLLAEPEPAPPP